MEQLNNEIELSLINYDYTFFVKPEIISKYFPEPKFEELIKKNKYILLSQIPVIESEEKYSYQIINFNSFPQPDFHSNIKQLYNNLSEHDEKNFKIYLYS